MHGWCEVALLQSCKEILGDEELCRQSVDQVTVAGDTPILLRTKTKRRLMLSELIYMEDKRASARLVLRQHSPHSQCCKVHDGSPTWGLALGLGAAAFKGHVL